MLQRPAPCRGRENPEDPGAARLGRGVIAALLVLFAGCQQADQSQRKALAFRVPPPADNVFRYAAIGAEFLDPARIGESAGHQLMLNVFEGLYAYSGDNSAPLPSMASRCDFDGDPLVVRCSLRPGVTWSDGVPITADDFVYSWRRALDPATASRSAHLLWFLAGARDFSSGKTTDPATVGVQAVDERTLRIQLAAPTPFFLHLLAEMPYAPTPRHVIQRWGKRWTRPQHIVSNGPYLLTEHVRRSRVTLRKNPRYWDAANVRIEHIEALLTESEQTAYSWYEVGKVHWTGDLTLPTDKLATLSRSGRADFHKDPYLCTYYYAFQTEKPPFDDPRVRRAFDLAIDRDRLLLHILRNGATAASGNVPDLFSSTHGYQARNALNFDPQRAQRLLAEAGFPGGVGLPTVELTFNTQHIHRAVAAFVQRSLRQHLGVHVTLANMEWKTLLGRMRRGDFQLSRSGWCADYPDPLTFLEVLTSGNSANYPRFADPTYDRLVEKVRGATDPELRNHMIFEAEQLLAEQRPILPIFHYARAYLLRPWVHGFSPQMQDFHPLKLLRFEENRSPNPTELRP